MAFISSAAMKAAVAALLVFAAVSPAARAVAAEAEAKAKAVGGAPSVPAGSLDIAQLGAKGDGKSDSTPMVLKAWKHACEATGQQKIVIPTTSASSPAPPRWPSTTSSSRTSTAPPTRRRPSRSTAPTTCPARACSSSTSTSSTTGPTTRPCPSARTPSASPLAWRRSSPASEPTCIHHSLFVTSLFLTLASLFLGLWQSANFLIHSTSVDL
ncbi:hypothetical protein ZEAMMB73_Zm00001d053662 [Zea mays]|uniref:Pectin lyase-like superfamily protein n=1 Tax=Zea mays TaxID=4577 RepID=A0A1D6QRA0_MAIZE|nr:hypothetical protein ZEAMMB73_Zm00001d053662 [Zea mays]